MRFLLGDACFFGLCPVGEGRTYGFGYVMQSRFDDPLEGRVERLRDRFAGLGGPVPEYLTALESDEQVHCSAMEWVEVDDSHAGRVVLIGDAAHASSPLMGQSGCMAMEDPYVLAGLLRSAGTVSARSATTSCDADRGSGGCSSKAWRPQKFAHGACCSKRRAARAGKPNDAISLRTADSDRIVEASLLMARSGAGQTGRSHFDPNTTASAPVTNIQPSTRQVGEVPIPDLGLIPLIAWPGVHRGLTHGCVGDCEHDERA